MSPIAAAEASRTLAAPRVSGAPEAAVPRFIAIGIIAGAARPAAVIIGVITAIVIIVIIAIIAIVIISVITIIAIIAIIVVASALVGAAVGFILRKCRRRPGSHFGRSLFRAALIAGIEVGAAGFEEQGSLSAVGPELPEFEGVVGWSVLSWMAKLDLAFAPTYLVNPRVVTTFFPFACHLLIILLIFN